MVKKVSVGHSRERHRVCPAAGSALSRVQHVLVRDDRRRRRGRRAEVADDVAAGADAAGLGDRLVAADVIAVHVRVDDVADRRVADRADGGEDLRAERRELRVDDHDAFGADVDGRVAAGADEHVDVVAHLDGVDLDVVEVLAAARRPSRRRSAAPTASAAATTATRTVSGKLVCVLIVSATLLLLAWRPSPVTRRSVAAAAAAESAAFFSDLLELRIHRRGAAVDRRSPAGWWRRANSSLNGCSPGR